MKVKIAEKLIYKDNKLVVYKINSDEKLLFEYINYSELTDEDMKLFETDVTILSLFKSLKEIEEFARMFRDGKRYFDLYNPLVSIADLGGDLNNRRLEKIDLSYGINSSVEITVSQGHVMEIVRRVDYPIKYSDKFKESFCYNKDGKLVSYARYLGGRKDINLWFRYDTMSQIFLENDKLMENPLYYNVDKNTLHHKSGGRIETVVFSDKNEVEEITTETPCDEFNNDKTKQLRKMVSVKISELCDEDVEEVDEVVGSVEHSGSGIATASSLNVRSGPGTKWPIIGTLHHDDIVNIMSAHCGWYKINFKDNEDAYVSIRYIKERVWS